MGITAGEPQRGVTGGSGVQHSISPNGAEQEVVFIHKKAGSAPFGAGDVVGDDVPPVTTGGYSHLPPLGGGCRTIFVNGCNRSFLEVKKNHMAL
jgi:hypothetical protein